MPRHPTAARWYLLASTLVWLPYGFFCFVRPDFLHDAAGIAASTATGTTELRAMYGGLQAALGLLTLTAVLRPAVAPTALTVLAFLCSGLFLSRLIGAVLDGGLSAYTACALVFECSSAVAALRLRR